MDPNIRTELRGYAWNYFALHSDQRIKTFNFYLVLCALGVAGVTSALKDLGNHYAATYMCFVVSFISFIFWKLDGRNKQLIKHAEAALKVLEDDSRIEDSDGRPSALKLFRREERDTEDLRTRRGGSGMTGFFSYSTCFNAVFALFGISGLIIGIVLFFADPMTARSVPTACGDGLPGPRLSAPAR